MGFIINHEYFCELPEIIARIRYCLRNQTGFSLVRIGDAENQVLAQGTIYPEEVIKNLWWANYEGWTGITLPNYEARDRLIENIKKADMVGVLHQNDAYEWKSLTEEVFTLYKIKPRQLCYAFVNTYLPPNEEFRALIKKCRLLLVGQMAGALAAFLQETMQIEVAGTVAISQYSQIDQVIQQIQSIDYNLALLSAGSNAVILAPMIASMGKIALDFGRSMNPSCWKPQRLHAHNIINSNNVGKPLIHNNFTCHKALHTRAYIKSNLPQRFGDKGGQNYCINPRRQ